MLPSQGYPANFGVNVDNKQLLASFPEHLARLGKGRIGKHSTEQAASTHLLVMPQGTASGNGSSVRGDPGLETHQI